MAQTELSKQLGVTTKGKQATFEHYLFRPMEKMIWDGPKQGWEDFFLSNADLADILGRTDLNFENFHVF